MKKICESLNSIEILLGFQKFTFKIVQRAEKKMQRITLILIISVVILPNFSFQSEISLAASRKNSECGKGIFKGTEPTVEKYPWMASIYFKDPLANEPAKLYGTATIITDRHLLTVANVIPSRLINSSDPLPKDLFAVVGGAYGVNGIIHYIKNIYKYYETEDPVLGGGLAIVQVVNQMKFSDCIKPICLPEIQYNTDIHQENQSITVVEWNIPSDNSSKTPVLYEANVHLQSQDYCQQFIEAPYPNDQLICGISVETSHKCGNGGPLMTSINGKYALLGVTDKIIGQSPDMPTYFLATESLTHMNWITNIIQSFQ